MEPDKIKILSIDDNPDNLLIVKALLEDLFPEVSVFTALSGVKGIELAAAEDPDVILLDIVMPQMDGFEVCRVLKADNVVSQIPVIFLTALKGDKDSRVKGIEAGGDAFLSKPVDETELLVQVRAMVKIKAANKIKTTEKVNLETLVSDRTLQLKMNHAATLNLLEDIKLENDERKKSGQALLETKRTLILAQQISHIGSWNWDVITNHVQWSDEMFSIFGIDRDEVKDQDLYKLFFQFIHPEDAELVRIANENAKNEERPFEYRIVRKNGEIRYVSSNSLLIRDEKGNVTEISGVIQDITQRKLAEAKLLESEHLYRLLTESIKDVVWILDIETMYFRYISPSVERLRGYTPEEVMAEPALKALTVEKGSTLIDITRKRAEKFVSGNSESHNFYTDEVEQPCKDGSMVWTEVITSYYLNPENGRVEVRGVTRDISDRKRSEKVLYENQQALLLANNQLHMAQHIGHSGSWYFDIKTQSVRGSVEAHRLFGFSDKEEDFSLSSIEACIPERERVHQALLDLLEKQIPYDIEYLIHPADGSDPKIIKSKATLENDADGNPVSLIGLIQDITQIKKNQQELIMAKEHAEESDRLKSAFLANMSHEIRTPMNGILGFTGLLKEPNLSGDQQQEYVKIIEKSGARMLNIINDIISISKVESGQVDTSISSTNINEQIEYIYTFFKPEVEKKGMQLFFRNPLPAGQAVIKTDREKVYAILTNLVKNAIKFTHIGMIEFGYEKKNEYLEFFVKDTGVGIRDEKKEIIFERFRQGSELLTRNYEGAGLGLSISKAFVELLGGKLWVVSELDQGSEFYFTIPYVCETEENRVALNEPDTATDGHKIKNLKILIAEDDEDSSKLLSLACKPFAKEVLAVSTGLDAIETCRKHPDIDLVMMDVKMPVMDGYEAVSRIRKFNKNVVIIAQTAFGLSGERLKAIKAGCNDYISKPIEKGVLMELLQTYFRKTG